MYIQILTDQGEPITRLHNTEGLSIRTDREARRFTLYVTYKMPNPEILEFTRRVMCFERWFHIIVKENLLDSHHTYLTRCIVSELSFIEPQPWERDDEGFVDFTWYAHQKFLARSEALIEEPIPAPVIPRSHSLGEIDWRHEVMYELDREILLDIRNNMDHGPVQIERPERVIRRDTRFRPEVIEAICWSKEGF